MKNSLYWHIHLLAFFMRRMPRSIRKVNWWWMRFYKLAGGGGFSEDPEIDERWPRGLQNPTRGYHHPFKLRFNLQDWMERRAFFSGSIYQTDLEELVRLLVRPKDQFVDVGANIGLVTLLAASLVGKEGAVIAFEANPDVFARLKEHVKLNNLETRVQLVDIALGAETSTARLTVPGESVGLGTLTESRGDGYEVRVEPGDSLLSNLEVARPLIVKLDVEGYEQKVLLGLEKTLQHPDCALIVEVTDDFLAKVGDSADGLYKCLIDRDFECFHVQLKNKRLNTELSLTNSSSPLNSEQYDALFVKRGSFLRRRLSANLS